MHLDHPHHHIHLIEHWSEVSPTEFSQWKDGSDEAGAVLIDSVGQHGDMGVLAGGQVNSVPGHTTQTQINDHLEVCFMFSFFFAMNESFPIISSI